MGEPSPQFLFGRWRKKYIDQRSADFLIGALPDRDGTLHIHVEKHITPSDKIIYYCLSERPVTRTVDACVFKEITRANAVIELIVRDKKIITPLFLFCARLARCGVR